MEAGPVMLWLFLGVLHVLHLHLVAQIAREKGRSYTSWFVAALFAPLVALIAVVLVGPVRPRLEIANHRATT